MKMILVAILLVHWLIRNCIQAIAMRTSASGGLKLVQVQVPPYRNPGDSASLHCDYDLGNDTLYSVKWYKEHEEFYRFVPKARPPANSYAVDGVKVDMAKSNSRMVVLHSISWKTSGLYRCEVSAEAPSFASAQSEGRMEVVALPQEDPIITGVEMQYQIGNTVDLNCTSGKSYPPSMLHWYINEQQVVNPAALKHYPPIHHRRHLYTTTVGLEFVLNQRHFHGGSMKVKCVSTIIPEIYRDGRQSESIVQSLPVQDRREALLLVKSSSSSTSAMFLLIMIAVLLIYPT